jgi:glycosyltransferase involved in cell wall biosynthesis
VLPGPAGHDGPLLACLVPARNCASDLPGFLESAARVADVIVALDDGSTDRSAEILESHPAVARLIRRPLRAGYAGWDDALNRRLLLEAADELKPRWILFLDADERIPADDAVALREFLQGEAAAGYAYCFRVYRTTEDLGSWDRAGLWVARLFAWEPGLRLPEERLHLVPVPQSIPRESFVRTTVRIQHLGGATEERRRDRLEKYREADPFGDHSAASASVRGLRPWTPRPSDLPVVMSGDPLDVSLTGVSPAAQTAEALEAPAVSVIVISRDDEDRIERAVRSVVEQQCPEPFEVIVVTSGRGRTASIVRETFPEVTVVELERPALPGQARNAGLAVAGGDYVSFPGSHVVVLPGSLAARLRAHRLGYGMVTGRMRNGTTTPAGWASYFLDHSSVLPGTPSGELAGPPAHCSYDRELLLEVGGFPSRMRAGEDTMVNIRLARRGVVAYGASDVELVHQSPCSTPLRLALHHFRRGRAHGRILLHDAPSRRMLGQGSGPGRIGLSYVERRMETIRGQVERDGGEGLRAVHRRVEPLIRMAAASAWAGIWCELLRPEAGKASVVAAEVIGPRLRRLVGGTTSR